MSLTASLKLVKGGLVVLDPATGAVSIELQYNPDRQGIESVKTQDDIHE